MSPLKDKNETKSRPTPVSVVEIRPASVARMRDCFAATVKDLGESKI